MNNCSLEFYLHDDELRVRHKAFLQDFLGKKVTSGESALELTARTRIYDTATGETIILGYNSLKKLLMNYNILQ